jgi:hypothetical protein
MFLIKKQLPVSDCKAEKFLCGRVRNVLRFQKRFSFAGVERMRFEGCYQNVLGLPTSYSSDSP